MSLINGFHLRNVRGDVLGGITAAVVALPLALAFGNAALGPGGAIYGLYGAVVVGFLAALFPAYTFSKISVANQLTRNI